MITKENYITASFIDNERKNIEVLFRDEKNEKVISHIVEYDEKYPVCQELLKIITLDDLHENTYQKKQKEKKAVEEMVVRIAKRDGLVFDEHRLDTKFYPTIVKAMFEETENEDHLFALKLALFELKQIRDSKDIEVKKKLRQAKNKIELLKIAIDLMS